MQATHFKNLVRDAAELTNMNHHFEASMLILNALVEDTRGLVECTQIEAMRTLIKALKRDYDKQGWGDHAIIHMRDVLMSHLGRSILPKIMPEDEANALRQAF